MKRSEIIFTAILVPVDFLMLVLAGLAAYFLRISPWIAQWRPVLFTIRLPFERYLGLVLLVSLIWLIIFALAGLYRMRTSHRSIEEFFRITIAASAGLALIAIYLFMKREWFDSRFLILAAWFLAIFLVTFGRWLVRRLKQYLVSHYGIGAHRVLVIGGDGLTKTITQEIKRRPNLGYRIIKHLDDLNLEEVKKTTANPNIDDIILANPNFPRQKVLQLIDLCEESRLNFKFVPNLFQVLTTNVDIDTLATVPLIELKRTALDGWGRVIKRTIDILGAIVCLIIFAPLMALITLMIKWESAGPVIYRNERVGPKGNFDVLKFRTMWLKYCTGKDYPYSEQASVFEDSLFQERSLRQGPVKKVLDDPRRTKVGRWLEKTSLDELPQFFNVFKGEMSLVGPRPHMPKEVAQYEKHHQKVFNIKSGVTGLAQISGRSDINFEDEVKLDAYYIEHWSLKLDLIILLKTPFIVLFRRHKQ